MAPNPVTTGAFRLGVPTPGDVSLAIFDAEGRRVRRLLDRALGQASVTFDGTPRES